MKDLISIIDSYIEENYLQQCLYSVPSFSDSIIDFTSSLSKSFSQTLLNMIDERGLVDTDVYKKANIDRRLFSKMRSKDYHPRKNTVIKLIFAIELDIDDAEELLESAGYCLTNSSLRDVIVMYFLENKEYDLFIINDVLKHYNQEYI